MRTVVLSSLLSFSLALSVAAHAAPGKADPDMQQVLDKLASLKGKPIETLTATEARRQPTATDAVKALMKDKAIKVVPDPKKPTITNKKIPGAAGEISVRIITPPGAGPFPVIVYFHGGGWAIADNDVYEPSMLALVAETHAVLVSPEYRLAPEHKFPAAHDDANATYAWVVKNLGELKGDGARIAVVGESAGGNLAANVAITARDKKIVQPVAQVLIYPVTGVDMTTPSYVSNADGKPLNKAMMTWFARQYFANPAQGNDPRITLTSQPNLKGLAPATIITAELDPLHDDGERYAKALKDAGVAVHYQSYDGVTHEFFGMGPVVKKAQAAELLAAGTLKDAFSAALKK